MTDDVPRLKWQRQSDATSVMTPFYSTNFMSNNECAYQGQQCIIMTKYIYLYETLHMNVDKSPLGILRVFLETVERLNYTESGLET